MEGKNALTIDAGSITMERQPEFMAQTLNEEIVRTMVQNGVVLGHKKSKTHPKMRPYVGGTKNEIELLSPEATWESLDRAKTFLEETARKGGVVLFAATNPGAKKLVREFAESLGFPYVVNRWLGGTLTNFPVIKGRIAHYQGLKEKKAKGELEKYTKKEQRMFAEEIGKMARVFDGLSPLTKLPEALFVVDAAAHETAVREARKLKLPIVAILDTNDDPSQVDYPIFASDRTVKSIQWVLENVAGSLTQGRAAAAAARDAGSEDEKKAR